MSGFYSRASAATVLAGLSLLFFATVVFAGKKDARDRWQEPERVLDVLKIRGGATLADLGAGYGYFTFRLAERAGPRGMVYAVDVSKPRLKHLRRAAQKAKTDRGKTKTSPVRVVHGGKRDSRLPTGRIELLLTVNTYHHLENRTVYFRRLKRVLKKGGRIAIIDYRPKDERYSGHSTDGRIIRREMRAAGYRLKREFKFLEKQNFFVYVPR